MGVWAVRAGSRRMWVRAGAARGPEVCAVLEELRLYVRRIRGGGGGSEPSGAGCVRSAWEEWIRAWVSPLVGDGRRRTAWSCLLGALRLCGVVRYGAPKGPTA